MWALPVLAIKPPPKPRRAMTKCPRCTERKSKSEKKTQLLVDEAASGSFIKPKGTLGNSSFPSPHLADLPPTLSFIKSQLGGSRLLPGTPKERAESRGQRTRVAPVQAPLFSSF